MPMRRRSVATARQVNQLVPEEIHPVLLQAGEEAQRAQHFGAVLASMVLRAVTAGRADDFDFFHDPSPANNPRRTLPGAGDRQMTRPLWIRAVLPNSPVLTAT